MPRARFSGNLSGNLPNLVSDAPPAPAHRRETAWLAAIVLAGLLARIATVVLLDIAPVSDFAEYRQMAISLLAGHGLVDSMGNRAMYNAGYSLFVLAPAFALFGPGLLAAQLANALLGAAGIVLCHAVAREAGAGRGGRLLAAAFWALYLPSWIYAEYLAKENLMTPLMLGVLWCSLRLARQPSLRVAGLCGLLFGLLAITGNSALALVAVAACALLIAPGGARLKLPLAVAALLAALAVAAPWMLRNLDAVGAPVLNTNAGFNLYLGNNPAADGLFMSISDTPRGASWEALRQEGELPASRTLGREATQWIREHPADFATLAMRKALLFWSPPTHAGKGPGSALETASRQIWLAQYLLLAALALGGLALPEMRTRQRGLLALALAAYTAVHMLFFVVFRYREPLMPILCVVGALVLEVEWRKGRKTDAKLH